MLILVSLVTLLASEPIIEHVQALQGPDTAAVERAAASYAAKNLLGRVPEGRVAFDSVRSGGRPRSHVQTAALAQILNADVTTRGSVISCASGPGSCKMEGYAGLIGVALTKMADSTAEVAVTIQWPSGQGRTPISTYEPVLKFAKKGADWQFVRVVSARSN